MSVRRSGDAGRLGAVAVLVVALGIGLAPTAASAAPAISISPGTTELVTGQPVTVSGSGFPGGGSIYLGMCPAGTTDPFSCDLRTATSVPVAGDGTFSASFLPSRHLRTSGSSGLAYYDCAVDSCVIGATDFGSSAYQEVTFADVPVPDQVTVSPTDGLVDGQAVVVSGTDMRPSSSVEVVACATHATGTICDREPSVFRTVTAGGELNVELPLDRVLTEYGAETRYVDCSVGDCWVQVNALDIVVRLPIRFAAPALDVTFDAVGTVTADGSEATTVVRVACDLATPVSFVATTSQGTAEATYRLGGLACAPGSPAVAHLPARVAPEADPFAPGTAQVDLDLWTTRQPYLGLPESVRSTAGGSVELVGASTMEDAVLDALAGPDGDAVRAELEAAFRARVRQDPVFRAWFAALLHALPT
ncbi:MAG: neocarzinostatin apoprotein domain-containing protein [Acidimicrobiales bacterium]